MYDSIQLANLSGEDPRCLALELKDGLWLSWKALKARTVTAEQLLSTIWAPVSNWDMEALPLVEIKVLTLEEGDVLRGELKGLSAGGKAATFRVSDTDIAVDASGPGYLAVSMQQMNKLLEAAAVLPATATFLDRHCYAGKKINGLELLEKLIVDNDLATPEDVSRVFERLRTQSYNLELFWKVSREHYRQDRVEPGGSRRRAESSKWTAELLNSSGRSASLVILENSTLRGICPCLSAAHTFGIVCDRDRVRSWYAAVLVACFMGENPHWCLAEERLGVGGYERAEIDVGQGLVAIHDCVRDGQSWLQIKGVNWPPLRVESSIALLDEVANFSGSMSDGLTLLTNWADNVEQALCQC